MGADVKYKYCISNLQVYERDGSCTHALSMKVQPVSLDLSESYIGGQNYT